MAALTLLEARGLAKDYGGLRAVDGVDLTLAGGEIRAIIGPNGAGKTTLVGLLCGRIQASAGHIRFAGGDVTGLPAHRRVALGIGYTFQVTSIFGNLTLFENVALAAQRHSTDIRAATEDALALVGLAGRSGEVAGTLSYGHQRLLEVAMGVALDPRLLILDEPTQGLAQGEIETFIGLIRRLAERATILLIEHNMEVVMALAERITVMDAGRILAEGTPAEIVANDDVQRAYLGG